MSDYSFIRNPQINASDIDFWNREQESVKLEFKMNMYPPRMKVIVDMSDSTSRKFKLSVNFEGCLNDDLDTELIFPLKSGLSLSHPCKCQCVHDCFKGMRRKVGKPQGTCHCNAPHNVTLC